MLMWASEGTFKGTSNLDNDSWINNPCQMKWEDKGLSLLWGHFCVDWPLFLSGFLLFYFLNHSVWIIGWHSQYCTIIIKTKQTYHIASSTDPIMVKIDKHCKTTFLGDLETGFQVWKSVRPVGPFAIGWWLVLGAPQHTPKVSWDRLQL